MSNLLKNHKIARENQKRWRIRLFLSPKLYKKSLAFFFELHNEQWKCRAGFNSSGWFTVNISHRVHDTVDKFKMRVGIVERSGKEIIALKARKSPKSNRIMTVEKLFYRSQMDSILRIKKWLDFFVEIKKKDEKTEVPMTEFQLDFKDLLLTGENSDVTIKVKYRKFKCHSVILGARSPVLKAMVEHDMKEKRCGEIIIKDSKPAVFEEFLLYLYSGSEKHVSMKNMIDLYELGDKYFMSDLKDLCVKRMITNISRENFFDIFLLSRLHDDTKLCKAAVELFLKHSENIMNSNKWTAYLGKYPDHISVLLETLEANK